MAGESVVISDLIRAAAEGASTGIGLVQAAELGVALQEFTIKVYYACTTEFNASANAEAKLGFKIFKAKFSTSASYKRSTTFGMSMELTFVGVPETVTAPS